MQFTSALLLTFYRSLSIVPVILAMVLLLLDPAFGEASRSQQKTRIAIVGGGIAGLATYIKLANLPNVEVIIIDSSDSLSGRIMSEKNGFGLGLTYNIHAEFLATQQEEFVDFVQNDLKVPLLELRYDGPGTDTIFEIERSSGAIEFISDADIMPILFSDQSLDRLEVFVKRYEQNDLFKRYIRKFTITEFLDKINASKELRSFVSVRVAPLFGVDIDEANAEYLLSNLQIDREDEWISFVYHKFVQ